MYFAPNASQQSSISQRLYLSHNILTLSKLYGLPKVCANIIALVFGVIAASIKSASTLCVSKSTSTNTGIAPNCTIGLTVVGKPAATPMTSSPFLMALLPNFGDVSVANATKLADEPELTVIKCLISINSDSSFSNLRLKRPVVSQPSNDASTIYCNSVAPITFPDGGTTLLPGLKVFSIYFKSANSCTSSVISNLNSSAVFIIHTLVYSSIPARHTACIFSLLSQALCQSIILSSV
ncbi:hypothetical protein BAZSYMB_GCONTIG00831_0 [Bathymodiolus azoricus thioautotrophic gill symbiont]|uniref:Uncharacterized protein n=1 Tax=Bathymodiolus azoricus thioautotrophic gill symbiont TaxID=235205 RepID=A0A1H6LLJ4_9GAMM|nr:hypothetical protein BAZSYMB_GCONTIG00831_0 [Bathymodiolus azoricus thioautotrophic gill symbiont]